jgi:hypothetical protein
MVVPRAKGKIGDPSDPRSRISDAGDLKECEGKFASRHFSSVLARIAIGEKSEGDVAEGVQ